MKRTNKENFDARKEAKKFQRKASEKVTEVYKEDTSRKRR